MKNQLSFSKNNFVKIALQEGKLKLKGNENKAGLSIEKYLSVFRETFAKRDAKYNDKQIGYDWCCAYVYYLLKEAGYHMDITPLKHSNWTLGAVKTWYDWSVQEGRFIDNSQNPEAGDLVLFNQLIENVDLDHIGIVIKNYPKYIVTSEGNYFNCAGIFKRNKNATIKGYIRL